jgi:hypothetical protein
MSSCLQEITLLLSGCLPSSYNTAIREIPQSSGRDQSHKGSHLGYMIRHQEAPTAIMPSFGNGCHMGMHTVMQHN